MSKPYVNGEEYYHRLYILFNGSIALTLLPMAWLLISMKSRSLVPIDASLSNYLFIACVISAAMAIMISARFELNRCIKSKAIVQESLRDKLNIYARLSKVMYMKFLVANALLVVGFHVTEDKIFIVGYVVGLILLSLKRPALSTFIEDLRLEQSEKTILLEKQKIP